MFRTSSAPRLRQALPAAAAATLVFLALLAAAQNPTVSGVGDISGIDPAIAPGDDFFAYANGRWLATTQIPADRSQYGPGDALVELTRERIAALIKGAAEGAAPGSSARSIGDYYATYLDAAAIESAGLKPLKPLLRSIDAIANRRALAQALGERLRADVDVLNATNLHTDNLLGLWVAQDLDDPTHYAPFLLQGGLVMPDRDYYLNPSQHMAEIRAQYQVHIATVLTLAGLPQPQQKAVRIFALEERIAAAHWTRAESEEVSKGNNHWPMSTFARQAPGLDWPAYFRSAGLGQQRVFVVWQPSALIAVSALTASEPLESWKDYLRFHLIEHYATYLPQALADEHFKFHAHILSGTPERKVRWKEAVDETNAAFGEGVGQLYAERYFPASEKARAEEMVHHLLAAFALRIDRLEWMAPQTRARAKAKVAALKVGVGYPDHWRSYAGLTVIRGDALGNARRSELFDYRYNLAKLARAVDRTEWAMTPQEVNAVNLPAMNAINFPAAILQPPYFAPNRDPVMDYGAIGATIGHEISHSFDDQGALFDASGRLQNWWTPEDFAHFEAAGQRLVAQYDAYHPFPDVAVKGKQTLSENIADVAGLSAAYDAWHSTLHGPAAGAAGFSAEQLFFLSFAQSWRDKIREAALRGRLVTDGHAPAEYRADTVRNLDAWYPAFKVQPGQRLYLAPAERVRIW